MAASRSQATLARERRGRAEKSPIERNPRMAGETATQREAPRGATVTSIGAAIFLVVAFGAALVITNGLRFAPLKDEAHFLSSARTFSGRFPPTLEQLRSYPEVINPLAFVVWGQLDRLTGDALLAGRWLNFAFAAAIVAGVALSRSGSDERRLLAAVGLVSYPYLLGLGVHLYTDVFASFLAYAGFRSHLRGRLVLGAACFALAIATRQYMVAVPACLAAWELWCSLGGVPRWRAAAIAAASAASLLGWFAFFDGFGPAPGLARWLPAYPAPMLEARAFILEYPLYALACLGGFFVLPEFVLFGRRIDWRGFARPRNLAMALAVAAAFALFPPVFPNFAGGGFDRLLRIAFPPGAGDVPRMACFALLAWLTCLRFGQRLDLACIVVAVHVAMLTKTQLAWDKYLMPAVIVLWHLKAEGALEGDRFPPRPSDDAGR
jgi:hypothetical protein